MFKLGLEPRPASELQLKWPPFYMCTYSCRMDAWVQALQIDLPHPVLQQKVIYSPLGFALYPVSKVTHILVSSSLSLHSSHSLKTRGLP